MSSTVSWETFMPEARHFAAQCWCDEETSHIPMDVTLAEAVAKRIAVWMDTSAQGYRDAEFYRNLLHRCGQFLGVEAYTSDDGTVQEEVLALKVPELVEKLVKQNTQALEESK